MPAYDQVKVWEIDPSPKGSARPQRKEPSRQPRIQPRSQPRWSRPSIDSKPLSSMVNFDWWTEEMGVWARLAVVGILATSILAWPYGHSCGFGLALYLVSTVMIIVGGIWVVACTWMLRMARTHAIAMALTLWGAALITAQILPRVGYAADAATWLCR